MRRPGSPLEGTRHGVAREAEELDLEIEAHLGHRIDDLMAEGVPEDDARRQAAREFGDAERIKAESRAVRRKARRASSEASAWASARQDLGFALRQLRHRPGFALAAILTLMLGIGATVTIASVMDAVVLAPLPFAEPDDVVFLEMRTPEAQPFSVSEGAFVDWREQARSFEAMAALHTVSRTQRAPGEPRTVDVTRVSHELLDVLGTAPALGRFFAPEEDRPAMGAQLALLSHEAWRTEFAGDAGVLGTTMDLDGLRYEVIGVMPDGLDVLTGDVPIFVPMGADPAVDRGDHYVQVVARLAPGASLSTADAELGRIQAVISEQHGVDLGWSTALRPARDELVGETVELGSWLTLATAAALLLMACVNVANLLMVRSTTRQTEIALRMALGASRGRLVRQLFTESAVLAVVGGLLGILLARTGLPLVQALGAGRIPRLEEASLDAFTLLAGLASVTLATLVCGLAPVIQLRARGLGRSMSGARGSGEDPGRRLRSTLVTAQIALTVVLLTGTGLLLRSFVALSSVDPGFDVEHTLAFSVDMPDASWTWQERRELMPGLREAVASVPGVVAVGATAVDPFSGNALANFVAAEGNVPDRAADFTPVHWRVVTPGFFDAMGMEILAGRDFRSDDDWEEGTPVIIGVSLARTLWGDDDALGRQMVWGDPQGSRMTVVGVVEDLRDVVLDEDPLPIIYRPHRQIPWAAMTMVARIDGDPASIVPGIRARIRQTVPGLPMGEVASLRTNLRQAVAEPRFNLQLLSVLALLGLILATVGVYGVTAFDVRRRLPEIGIRLSLGARPEEIRRMILRQRLATTAVGLGVGLAVAWLLSGLVRSLLYGIGPRDPVTWIGVVLTVGVAALAAAYGPARRATRVDPSSVLNAE